MPRRWPGYASACTRGRWARVAVSLAGEDGRSADEERDGEDAQSCEERERARGEGHAASGVLLRRRLPGRPVREDAEDEAGGAGHEAQQLYERHGDEGESGHPERDGG